MGKVAGSGGAELSAVQLSSRPPLALHGFRFSYRSSLFDWRLLHGIDAEAVVTRLGTAQLSCMLLGHALLFPHTTFPLTALQVRLTDVRAVEDCLDTLQHGNFASERGLSARNCIHLFRLLQLATEYLWHLRNAHISLLDQYQQAVAGAERCAAVIHTELLRSRVCWLMQLSTGSNEQSPGG
jgi:hypothetical protein